MKTVVVLCIQRSGSSILAGMLHHLGVSMGSSRDLKRGKHANKLGCFENQQFLSLSHTLLYEAGSSAIYYQLVDGEKIVEAVKKLTPEIKILLKKYEKKKIWGWKDPVTFQIIPYIHEMLEDPHYIFLYRKEENVAKSIKKMSNNKNFLPALIHELSLYEKWKRKTGIFRRMYKVYRTRGDIIHDDEYLAEFITNAYSKIETFVKDKKHLRINFNDLVNDTANTIDKLSDFLEEDFSKKNRKHALNFLHPEFVNFK
jgi:hypothetical protein